MVYKQQTRLDLTTRTGLSVEESGARTRLDDFLAGFGGISGSSLMGIGVSGVQINARFTL